MLPVHHHPERLSNKQTNLAGHKAKRLICQHLTFGFASLYLGIMPKSLKAAKVIP